MTYLSSPTITELKASPDGRLSSCAKNTLKKLRTEHSYVLLGTPYSDIKNFLQQEAKETHGTYHSIQEFLSLDHNPSEPSSIFYIDALGQFPFSDYKNRHPLALLRQQLEYIHNPPFRLSFEEVYWFQYFHRYWSDFLGNPKILRITSEHSTPIDKEKHDPSNYRNSNNQKDLQSVPAALDSLEENGILEQLCALQLLSGAHGFTLSQNKNHPRYLPADKIKTHKKSTLVHILQNHPFRDTPLGKVISYQRQTVAFLAAKYLSYLMDQGLTLKNIISLITTPHGEVVSQFRILVAWLALLNQGRREELIQQAPLSILMYGNIDHFSTTEKKQLILAISTKQKKHPWLESLLSSHPCLKKIASAHMKPIYKTYLSTPHSLCPELLNLFIQSLKTNDSRNLMGLSHLIKKIIRDDRLSSSIRTESLDLLLSLSQQRDENQLELYELIQEVHNEKISDPDDDLLGTLLTALYPHKLSVSELWSYLKTPKNPSLEGRYYQFWCHDLPKKSSHSQLTKLLDELIENFKELKFIFMLSCSQKSFLRTLPMRWLRHIFSGDVENLANKRLLRWLTLLEEPALWEFPQGQAFLRGLWSQHSHLLYEHTQRSLSATKKPQKSEGWLSWQEEVQSKKTQLRQGKAQPHLLYQLAQVYFGHFLEIEGASATDRLKHFVGHDDDLYQSALQGLTTTLERDDLPKEKTIIKLRSQGKKHMLSLPFLAGWEERLKYAHSQEFILSQEKMRQALAFFYTDSSHPCDQPNQHFHIIRWHEKICTSHTQMVVDLLLDVYKAEIKNKAPSLLSVYKLPADKTISGPAALRFIHSFPTRSKNTWLTELAYLFNMALTSSGRESLVEITLKKSSLASMNMAQKVFWRTLRFFFLPHKYREDITGYLSNNERRLAHFTRILCLNFPLKIFDELQVAELYLLFCVLAKISGPSLLPSLNAQEQRARFFLRRLECLPSKEATNALQKLLDQEKLHPWHPILKKALSRQLSLRYEKEFHPKSLDQILSTLALKPAPS